MLTLSRQSCRSSSDVYLSKQVNCLWVVLMPKPTAWRWSRITGLENWWFWSWENKDCSGSCQLRSVVSPWYRRWRSDEGLVLSNHKPYDTRPMLPEAVPKSCIHDKLSTWNWPELPKCCLTFSKWWRTSSKVVHIGSRLVATTTAVSLLNGWVKIKDGTRSSFERWAIKVGIGTWLTSRRVNIKMTSSASNSHFCWPSLAILLMGKPLVFISLGHPSMSRVYTLAAVYRCDFASDSSETG